MSEEHSVSRRASLKSLGTMGAAIAFGGGIPPQVEPKPARADRDVVNVVDLAAGRMEKGHS